MLNHRGTQRGSVMLEFALAGVATMTILVMTVQLSIGMWHYHTLSYAVHEAARRASVHGRGCVSGSTLCPITVGDIVTGLLADSVGIPASEVNVTLTTDSGATTTWNPSTSCVNNATRWPPSSNLDNAAGKRVSVQASYSFAGNMLVIWPGAFSNRINRAFLFPAKSTEVIVF